MATIEMKEDFFAPFLTVTSHILISSVKWASSWENLSLGVCEQHRRRPACASAQSYQHLCFSFFGKNHIKPCYRWNFSFLASLCRWGDRFETRFEGNREDSFSRDEAQMIPSRHVWTHIVSILSSWCGMVLGILSSLVNILLMKIEQVALL